MNLKMNIGYNKSTKELIGYAKGKHGKVILVTAYAVDDLQKKFDKELKKLQAEEDYIKNHAKAMQYLSEQDERETQLMINTIENMQK